MDIIEITDNAIDAIKKFKIDLQINEDQSVRIGIHNKNEINRHLYIGFDKKTEKDNTFETKGITVIFSKTDIFFFAGMKIDFTEKDGRKGFTFAEQKKSSI